MERKKLTERVVGIKVEGPGGMVVFSICILHGEDMLPNADVGDMVRVPKGTTCIICDGEREVMQTGSAPTIKRFIMLLDKIKQEKPLCGCIACSEERACLHCDCITCSEERANLH